MMNSSVPLYQCWLKKVSDLAVAHFPSHRSGVITVHFTFPFLTVN